MEEIHLLKQILLFEALNVSTCKVGLFWSMGAIWLDAFTMPPITHKVNTRNQTHICIWFLSIKRSIENPHHKNWKV